MKKIVLIAAIIISSFSIKAQDFNDFYEHIHGVFTPWSYSRCNSSFIDSSIYANGVTMWGLLSYEGIISQDEMWEFSWWIKTRQIGDMMAALRNMLTDKGKLFSTNAYFSDFGFLPNLRFGPNVLVLNKTIVNVGVMHNYYIYKMATPTSGVIKNDLLCVGPHIYVDQIITDFLAARIGFAPQYKYASGTNNDFKYKVWELNLEVFTKWGLYFGVDIAHLGGLKTDLEPDISFNRIDYKLGYKFKQGK